VNLKEYDFPGPNKPLSNTSSKLSGAVPEVTVWAAVSALFQTIVSLIRISTVPEVEPSFSLCQK